MSGDDKITLEMVAQLKKLIADPIIEATRLQAEVIFKQAEDIKQINEKMGIVITQNEAYSLKIEMAAQSFEEYRRDHFITHERIDGQIDAITKNVDCNIKDVDDKVIECQKNCIKTLQPLWREDFENALSKTENKELKKKMSKLTKIAIAAVSILGPLVGFFANKFFGVTK